MHEYTLDTNRRWSVAQWCVAPAIAATILANAALNAVGVSVPWFMATPSPLVIYGAMWAVIDHILWPLNLRGYQPFGVPDLRGTWKGCIRSTHDRDGSKVHKAILQVRQRWTRISVCLETQHSGSVSVAGSLFSEAGDGKSLRYIYHNKPRVFATETMYSHEGAATLRLSQDGSRLRGEYYTGQHRLTAGEMEFELLSRDILDFGQVERD